jgi:hypothetical protein
LYLLYVAIYLKSTTPTELDASLASSLEEYENKLFTMSSSSSGVFTSCTSDLPTGPYFLSAYTGDVFLTFRLYSDYEGAFTEGVLAGADGTYTTMSASIAVILYPRSFLYFTAN